MFKKWFAILCILSFSFVIAQKITIEKKEFVALNATEFIGFDSFKNYFYIKDNVIYKKTDVELLQYQNLALGKITKVDILNPLKVIVFYEEFNSVIILDNFLNEIQKIEFSNLETPVVTSAMGISGQNKLWLFNTLNQQIGLYDLTTNQYQNLGIPINDGFQYYQTDFNYFHWIDKQNNWFTCTIFGRIIANGKTEFATKSKFISENKMLFSKDDKLYLSDLSTNKTYEIEIVEKTFQKFYYKDQILSIFTDQGITNYKITLP